MGGQAEIFIAKDAHTAQRVAVKLARTDSPDKQGDQRLQAEARILQEVKAPSVVKLLDAGFDEDLGCYCLVEELVPGVALARVLDRGEAVEPAAALCILEQVAQGLEALHKTGYIMRDLTPSQVIVEQDANGPTATLIDLGLARSMRDETGLTEPHLMAGTPGFTAPEMARGETPTTAADTYSLGVLTYWMLTGVSPFAAPTREASVALQLTGAFVPLPRSVEVSGGRLTQTDNLLRSAMAGEPSQRPETPAEFVEAFRLCLQPPSLLATCSPVFRLTGAIVAVGLAVWAAWWLYQFLLP